MKTDNRTRAKELSQTLSRGIKLLELIANSREGTSVRDLALEMRLPRSIVQRLLYTLENDGFLERHPSQIGYRLSMKLWVLGCAVIRRVRVRDIARPYLEELAQKTKEMAKLGVLDGHEVVYIDRVDCLRAIRAYVPIGGRAPVHSTSTGKAILAFLSPQKLAEVTASIKRFTKRTLVTKEELAKQLEEVRKRGYATNLGEWEDEVGGVAAPIRNANNEVIASIGVIAPLSRLTPKRVAKIGDLVLKSAADIARELGHEVQDSQTLKMSG
jgi:DNA-binding IclR family transcriptional regulator